MNKLILDKKYTQFFVNLNAEDLKQLLLSLLKEDLSSLNPEIKMLAQIIYNENFTVREKRKRAKKENVDKCELSTESYPHFEQNEQNEQIPPYNPPLGLINNLKNNNTSARTRTQEEKISNVFNQHLNESGRVRERTAKERKPYFEGFKDLFALYEIKINDEISIKANKELKAKVLIEIIDTLIEAHEQSLSKKGLYFKARNLKPEDICRLAIDIDEETLKPLMNFLVPNKPIRNRPYYILSCLINNTEEKRGKFNYKGENYA